MKTINAIIIDDEKHARESLQELLKLYCPSIHVLATSSNIQQGKLLIENQSPDLVFLDISIGEETGFDLLKTLNEINFQIIFITAFSNHALKAFRVNALDYLLKPIDPIELKSAVGKALQSFLSHQFQSQINYLTQSLKYQEVSQIAIAHSDGVTYLEISNIVHIEGNANYSTFFSQEGETLMASKSLKHFEAILPSRNFFRCHQSHLVNLDYVKKVNTKESNSIEFRNGVKVPFARSKKEELMDRLSVKVRN